MNGYLIIKKLLITLYSCKQGNNKNLFEYHTERPFNMRTKLNVKSTHLIE